MLGELDEATIERERELKAEVTAEIRMNSGIQQKTYIRVPNVQRLGRIEKLWRALAGSVLSPAYWLLAHRYHVPGLRFRLDCARLGLRLLYNHKAPVSYPEIYGLLFWPMDSTRYFEFAFMWDALSKQSPSRYLDVSSPRLFPIILILKKYELFAELLNPDAADLTSTAKLVEALRLENRCNLRGCLVSAAPFEPGSFDVITSISVVEHIPQDTQAVQKMWDLLKPGGRLLLTLPCAAQTSEQYINRNEYGLLAPDEEGYFFFQRLYDQRLLEERIFPITGQPRQCVIYGERSPGTLRRNLDRKMGDPYYPYWREPYMMGQDFCYFKRLGELPGEGVIALEFKRGE
jgi:SAM-dependent methyltransferase